MQSRFRTTLFAWSALIMAVLLSVAFMGYHSAVALRADNERVNHTYIVIGVSGEVLSQLKDVEAGQRGYVITGRDEYLKRYTIALPLLEENLKRLEALTSDNPDQLRRLQHLRRAIAIRLALMARVVEARRERGFEAARQIILSNNNRQVMDIIRHWNAEMNKEERRLLEARSQDARASARFALSVGAIGLLVAALIIVVILNLVRLETLRRMEVEAGLEKTNHELQISLDTMERLTREMTALTSLAEMLQSCRTTEEAYDAIRRVLLQLLPQKDCTLGIINASQNLVEVVLRIPQEGRVLGRPLFAPEECWALRRGHIHFMQDVQSDAVCAHLLQRTQRNSARNDSQNGANQDEAGVLSRSMLCLPLMAHGETLGVMTIVAQPGENISEADQRVAFSIAEHASLALANLKLQETLRTQSIRDPLSGLFNRRYMEASFEREIARARRHNHPVSVVMIDIDFFKKFNDSLGHEAGDMVVQEFGNFLQSQCRGEDIACRYGGEEFIIILPELSFEYALKRAEQIRLGAEQLQVEYRRQRLPGITISAGIATFPIHGSDNELIRAADEALYRAKKAGRNRVAAAMISTTSFAS